MTNGISALFNNFFIFLISYIFCIFLLSSSISIPFTRVQSIKILGMTFSRKFSVSQHVDELLATCSQSLFALRTLRQHGLPEDALHAVFQAIVINRLSYASPAWWGFVSADDRHRLDAFLSRSTKLGYRSNSSATFTSICDDADNQLFDRIAGNSQHLLHSLLPLERDQHYSLRERSHNYQLPGRTTAVNDKNFIVRILHKDETFNDKLYFNCILFIFYHCTLVSGCLSFYYNFIDWLIENESWPSDHI